MSERTIRQLDIRASSRADATAGQNLIAEAMRVTSVPFEDQPGVLYVRSLELGALALDSSSLHLVAERFRTSLLRATPLALTSGDAALARADLVAARVGWEPYVELLLRQSRRRPTNAWVWRAAVRVPAANGPREETLVQVFAALIERSDVEAAALSIAFEAMADTDALDIVLGQLDALRGARLCEVLRVPPAPPRATAAAAGVRRPQTSAHSRAPASRTRSLLALERALANWVPRWGASDPRAVAIATVAADLEAGRVSWPTAIRRERIDARLEQAMASAQPPALDGSPAHSDVGPSQPTASATEVRSATAPAPEARPPTTYAEPAPEDSGVRPVRATDDAPDVSRDGPPRPAPADERTTEEPADVVADEHMARPSTALRPLPTVAGGVFFLLLVLDRLGIERWLDDAEMGAQFLAAAVLARALDRLEVPKEDPVWAALDLRPADLPPAEMVEGWLTDVGDYLHDVADVGLEDVVLREAAVAVTRTHVDVVFDLASADVRLRRYGLDFDPGWVPWFGYVVTFHFVHGGVL